MIDFACKQFKLDEVIKCGLGLAKADYKLLEYLMKHTTDWYTTEQLAKTMNLNLSTIQRSVKKLYERDILQRNQQNLDNGGYIFIYKIKDKSHIKKRLMEIVQNWVKKVDLELNHW